MTLSERPFSLPPILEYEVGIVYEDDDLAALRKPSGMLVEGTRVAEQTLTDWACSYLGKRVRPLHRIDRDTTGLVLFAKNSRWNREFSEMFERKRIRKEYWVVVCGQWDSRVSRIETRIRKRLDGRWENHAREGKRSTTTFRVLGRGSSHSWLQALPKTGRTHQIRLHCVESGCPVVGDRLYSADKENPFLLHARGVAFRHPAGTGDVVIETAPPEYWAPWLEAVSNKGGRAP